MNGGFVAHFFDEKTEFGHMFSLVFVAETQ